MNIQERFSSSAILWQGVRFRYRGYNKNGCDCIGLIVGVLTEMNVMKTADINDFNNIRYPVHLKNYNHAVSMKSMIDKFFVRNDFIDLESLQNGDVLYMRTKNGQYHFAIFYEQMFIHTTLEVGCVVHGGIDLSNYCIEEVLRLRDKF
ncbi:MAG: hypothetical protein RL208_734 [Pseudomonadota bacterium]|jgi:cell wall-associated NlpC family hydrolase